MFTFTPKTEEELSAINLLEPGEGLFEVIQAIQKTSKSGNNMIEMKLRAWDKNGKEKIIHDYLVNIPELEFKIKHFCESTGMIEKYQQGKFTDIDCVGKTGKLKLIIKKDKTGDYADKNSVADYIKTDSFNTSENNFINDDLPF